MTSTQAFLFRPTKGSFLLDYHPGDDLHVGLTDSKGNVVEFDTKGVRRRPSGHSKWRQCLAVPVLTRGDRMNPHWTQKWDRSLDLASDSELFHRSAYEENGQNCFSFVLHQLKVRKCDHFNNELLISGPRPPPRQSFPRKQGQTLSKVHPAQNEGRSTIHRAIQKGPSRSG